MNRFAVSLAVLAFAAACSEAPDTPDVEPADTETVATSETETASAEFSDLVLPLPDATTAAITAEDLAVRVKTLADDAFEGRGPGSEVGERAPEWIAAEMARIGLEPGGDNGSWFQTVEMVDQTLDETASSLTFSDSASGDDYPMEFGNQAVMWTKHQKEMELSFDDSELVFVGYGVVAPEYDWNDYEGLDMTGKTAVILVNDPGFESGNPELFKGKAMTYYGRWTYKFEEAARQGATGAIIIHEAAPAAYGWDVVKNSWSGAQADLVRADGGAERATYEGWITLDVAKKLLGDVGLDYEELKVAAREPGFTAVDMGDLTASGKVVQTVEEKNSRNVIGILPGQTAPDEYVLYTAHWDHLGKKTGEKTGAPGEDFYKDDIFNGAVDNATGVAGILDIAEAMATQELDRSVMFLSVTLEESGLLGSAYYAENPTVPLSSIVAGINIDAMLPTGPSKEMVVVGYGASELEDRLKAVLEAEGRTIEPDPTPETGSFYRSDHVNSRARVKPRSQKQKANKCYPISTVTTPEIVPTCSSTPCYMRLS